MANILDIQIENTICRISAMDMEFCFFLWLFSDPMSRDADGEMQEQHLAKKAYGRTVHI